MTVFSLALLSLSCSLRNGGDRQRDPYSLESIAAEHSSLYEAASCAAGCEDSLARRCQPKVCFTAAGYLEVWATRQPFRRRRYRRYHRQAQVLSERGLQLLETGCQEGDATMCLGLAEELLAGGFGRLPNESGADAVAQEAIGLLEPECSTDTFNAGSCHTLAEAWDSLAPLLDDPVRSDWYRARACQHGHESDCTSLVWQYGTQLGPLPADAVGREVLTEELSEYHDRCQLGEPEACYLMGLRTSGILGVRNYPSDGLQLAFEGFKKQCASGEAVACWAQGHMTALDKELQIELYESACRGGAYRGCQSMGELEMAEGRFEAALPWFEQACSVESSSCGQLAAFYETGLGVPEDAERATALHQTACLAGMQSSCSRQD